MATVKKFDLSKFDKLSERQRFLKPVEVVTNENKRESKPEKVKVKNNKRIEKTAKVIGRPMAGEEPLTEKVGINLTHKELENLKKKLGLVPVASYLRNALKEKGII